jgi:DNA-binding ferritin-like protein (Dps family)
MSFEEYKEAFLRDHDEITILEVLEINEITILEVLEINGEELLEAFEDRLIRHREDTYEH